MIYLKIGKKIKLKGRWYLTAVGGVVCILFLTNPNFRLLRLPAHWPNGAYESPDSDIIEGAISGLSIWRFFKRQKQSADTVAMSNQKDCFVTQPFLT